MKVLLMKVLRLKFSGMIEDQSLLFPLADNEEVQISVLDEGDYADLKEIFEGDLNEI